MHEHHFLRDVLIPIYLPITFLRHNRVDMDKGVLSIRLALGTTAAAALLGSEALQPALDSAWKWLLDRSFYHTSYFETIWTISLYILFEHYYVSLATSDKPRPPLPERIDQRAGRSHLWRNGTVRVRKIRGRLMELVTYVSPLLFLDLLLIKKFKGVSWEAMVSSGGYDPALLMSTMDTTTSNQTSYSRTSSSSGSNARPANIGTTHFLAPSVHNMTLSSPLQLWRALPADPPSPRRLLLELVASIVLYDAVFFLVHLSLHKVPYLYSKMHATHHDHAELHAQVTNQLDIGERLMLVLTANFSLQIIGAHVLTRTLFVPLFVLFLVQNHCGLNVLSYDKILPAGWGAGPIVHAQHHRLGHTGYAPYFRWCDVLYEHLTGKAEHLRAERAKDSIRIERLLERSGANRAE